MSVAWRGGPHLQRQSSEPDGGHPLLRCVKSEHGGPLMDVYYPLTRCESHCVAALRSARHMYSLGNGKRGERRGERVLGGLRWVMSCRVSAPDKLTSPRPGGPLT